MGIPTSIKVGSIFGRLIATEFLGGRRAKWLCRCTCNVETSVTSSALRSGNTRNCGCLRTELVKARGRALSSSGNRASIARRKQWYADPVWHVIRLWKRTEWRGDCLEFTGSTDRLGYGWFQGLSDRKAHRVVAKIIFGTISKHLVVCHECDNPRGVNPSHLWLGTPRENAQDASRKGRLKRRNTPPSQPNPYYAQYFRAH